MKLIKRTVTVETFICEASECTCNCGSCICGACTCNCNCNCSCSCTCSCSPCICNCTSLPESSNLSNLLMNSIDSNLSNDKSAGSYIPATTSTFGTVSGTNSTNALNASINISKDNTYNGYRQGSTSTSVTAEQNEAL